YEIPFDFKTKRMISVFQTPDPENERFLYIKGSSERIIDRSARIFENEKELEFTGERKKEVLSEMENMAEHGLRILAFAYKKIHPSVKNFEEKELEKDLVFVGLAGMIDPPREEVGEAIKV